MLARRRYAVAGRSPAARLTALLLLTGLPAAALAALPVAAQTEPPARTEPAYPYAGLVAEAARRFGISEAWIRAVMRAESRNDVHATSAKGAMGLMQIMPATWAELRTRYALGSDRYGRVGMERFTPLTGASFSIPLAEPE